MNGRTRHGTKTYPLEIRRLLVKPREDLVQVQEKPEMGVIRIIMFLVLHLFRTQIVRQDVQVQVSTG